MMWLDEAERDPALMPDFHALCGFGGRLAGSGQEDAALDWALGRLRESGADASRVDVAYDGWRCLNARLQLVGVDAPDLACKPLLRSQSTPAGGLEGAVLDLGAGRLEDFDRAGDRVQGKIVLVRHEYPFSPQHVHRRRKYDLALARGAIGFLIANPTPGGGLLSGSSGRRQGAAGIPAAYIDHASSERIVRGPARVRLIVEGEEQPQALAGIAVLDLPGRSDSRVVISAHIDGHDLGRSALDNATGVVVALAAARALAPRLSSCLHGLRVCLFSAEEWALAGSARYLGAMKQAELNRLKLDINLDTVAGSDTLTALISDFPHLQDLVAKAASLAGTPLATHLPLMPNSDHANFAAHGIPALRLVAGFDQPQSRVRHILSAGDLPAVVHEDELRRAVRVTCALAWLALRLPAPELALMAERAA